MKHLAVIMDGNRRWAKKNGLQPWVGHKEGATSIRRIVDFCLKKEISYLSLYAFSLENFNRSEQERMYLFEIIKNEAFSQLGLFLEHGVRVRFLGERNLFPTTIVPVIEEIEVRTKDLTKLNVNFLFCYGGRQEIIGGVKKLLQKINDGLITQEEISEKDLSDCLLTAGMPEPDMIVRTGGAVRLSNFLLFQAAYSEFFFLDCLWPEIKNEHLENAYDKFTQTQRNFGT